MTEKEFDEAIDCQKQKAGEILQARKSQPLIVSETSFNALLAAGFINGNGEILE